MRLISTGTSILAYGSSARPHVEPKNPRRVEAVLIAQGWRPKVAHIVANGGMEGDDGAAVARWLGVEAGLTSAPSPSTRPACGTPEQQARSQVVITERMERCAC